MASYRNLRYPITLLKAYRYRLVPTDEPAACLTRQFGSVRDVYNWALDLAATTYQTQGPGITQFPWDKRLTALQQEWPWLQEVVPPLAASVGASG